MFGHKYKLSEDARDATCNAPWWGNTDAMGKYLRDLLPIPAQYHIMPEPDTETIDSESWEEKLLHVDGGGEWRVFDDHIPGSRASNDEVDSSREMWPLLLLYRGVFSNLLLGGRARSLTAW